MVWVATYYCCWEMDFGAIYCWWDARRGRMLLCYDWWCRCPCSGGSSSPGRTSAYEEPFAPGASPPACASGRMRPRRRGGPKLGCSPFCIILRKTPLFSLLTCVVNRSINEGTPAREVYVYESPCLVDVRDLNLAERRCFPRNHDALTSFKAYTLQCPAHPGAVCCDGRINSHSNRLEGSPQH